MVYGRCRGLDVMSIKNDAIIIAGIAIALLVAGWYAKKKIADAAAVVGEFAGEAWDVAAQVTDTAIAAPVLATGDVLGVPRTNMTECERAKAEGRTLDASFACPAGDFISYIFN